MHSLWELSLLTIRVGGEIDEDHRTHKPVVCLEFTKENYGSWSRSMCRIMVIILWGMRIYCSTEVSKIIGAPDDAFLAPVSGEVAPKWVYRCGTRLGISLFAILRVGIVWNTVVREHLHRSTWRWYCGKCHQWSNGSSLRRGNVFAVAILETENAKKSRK